VKPIHEVSFSWMYQGILFNRRGKGWKESLVFGLGRFLGK
jgi:hypothetical protein